MMLATDLDRTLLPNGPEPDDGSLSLFGKLIEKYRFVLVYVTGRNLELVSKAIEKYDLPQPAYVIAEVGTFIYQSAGSEFTSDTEWEKHLRSASPNWQREMVVEAVGLPNGLTLQEGWKQNLFKVSYYLREVNEKKAVLEKIGEVLRDLGVEATTIWSADPLQGGIGLIDVLPAAASKVAALEFLRRRIGLSKNEVIYCGDSGNDFLPLTFGYRAIVVNNAPPAVKAAVRRFGKEKGVSNKIYFAVGQDGRNGNYASGIIEGLEFFLKQ